MSKKYRGAIAAALFSIVFDRSTKVWIARNFSLYQSKEAIKGFLNITYLLNRGAAFGMFAQRNAGWVRPFLVVVSIFALFLIVYFIVISKDDEYLARISLGLIFGGAIGNLIDRVLQGQVIDFLDFYIRGYHWPPFNIADVCITVGVFIFLLSQIGSEKSA